MKLLRCLPLLAAAVLVGGCSSLLRSTAPVAQTYVLRADVPAAATGQPLPLTLQWFGPSLAPGLDSTRILLLRSGNRLDYYAGGHWAAPLGGVLDALLLQTLRDSGQFAQVVSDGVDLDADMVLAVTVRRFEMEQAEGGLPVAQTVFDCTLSSRREQRPLASFRVSAQVPADANRLGSVVAALQQAARQAAQQVLQQTVVEAGRASARQGQR